MEVYAGALAGGKQGEACDENGCGLTEGGSGRLAAIRPRWHGGDSGIFVGCWEVVWFSCSFLGPGVFFQKVFFNDSGSFLIRGLF